MWHRWRQNAIRFVEGKGFTFNPSVKDIVVHCGMINLNHNKPKATVDVIIKIGKVFQEKLAADVNVILTGLLPQDMNKSKRKNKILKVYGYLKNSKKMKPTYTTYNKITTGFIKTNHSTRRCTTSSNRTRN